jgi:hypothetical protein
MAVTRNPWIPLLVLLGALALACPTVAQSNPVRRVSGIQADNVAIPVSGGNYRWTLFLKANTPQNRAEIEDVASVTYYLHPTFSPSTILVQRYERNGRQELRDGKPCWSDGRYYWADDRAFAYTAVGWGGFYMKIVLKYRDGSTYTIDRYYLDLRKRA